MSSHAEETLENDNIGDITYCSILTSDKKRVAYVVLLSKLGLVAVHILQLAKPKECEEFLDAFIDRRQSAQQSSLVCAVMIG